MIRKMDFECEFNRFDYVTILVDKSAIIDFKINTTFSWNFDNVLDHYNILYWETHIDNWTSFLTQSEFQILKVHMAGATTIKTRWWHNRFFIRF